MEGNDDFYARLARAKRKTDNGFPSAEARARIRFSAWLLYLLAFGIVIVTVWVTTQQFRISNLEIQVTKNSTAIDAQRLINEASKLLFEQQRVGILANSEELKKRETDVNHVHELWFMKEHGISNKEDFILRHGYPAPTSPNIENLH